MIGAVIAVHKIGDITLGAPPRNHSQRRSHADGQIHGEKRIGTDDLSRRIVERVDHRHGIQPRLVGLDIEQRQRRVGGARNVRSIALPLIIEHGRAAGGHGKMGRTPHRHRLARRLGQNGRRIIGGDLNHDGCRGGDGSAAEKCRQQNRVNAGRRPSVRHCQACAINAAVAEIPHHISGLNAGHIGLKIQRIADEHICIVRLQPQRGNGVGVIFGASDGWRIQPRQAVKVHALHISRIPRPATRRVGGEMDAVRLKGWGGGDIAGARRRHGGRATVVAGRICEIEWGIEIDDAIVQIP